MRIVNIHLEPRIFAALSQGLTNASSKTIHGRLETGIWKLEVEEADSMIFRNLAEFI